MHSERPNKSSRTSSSQRNPCPLTLNDLPQFAIDEILTRLPIETAVATSLISRFWRHRWKSIPDLTFFHLPRAFVSQALLLHTAPIHSFCCISLQSNPYVDGWLVTLASRAANSLHLLDLAFVDQARKYPLHSSAYSLPNLTRLGLHGCRLNPPLGFAGFKNLVNLQLEKVGVPDVSQLSSLISESPFLESVCLWEVKGRGCLKIDKPSLRLLDYVDVEFDDFLLGSAPLLYRADIRLCLKDCDERYGNYGYEWEGPWLGLGLHSLKVWLKHIMNFMFNIFIRITVSILFINIILFIVLLLEKTKCVEFSH